MPTPYYVIPEDQAKALGVSPNQALSEAQEAGIEAVARGEQGTVDITNVPGTPTYVPPTEGKPVSYVIPEDQAKALGVSPNQALSEAQEAGIEAVARGEQGTVDITN
ncbi:MAG: hypothetical protein WC554_11775, partial [Clostridia bacterium]